MIESSSYSFNETKSSTIESTKWNTKSAFALAVLVGIFSALQIVSNVCAGKVLAIGPLSVAGAAVVYAFVGITMDLISNCFGSAIVKKTTWLGVIINVCYALICALVIIWPAASYFTNSEAYRIVLSTSIRLVIAGIIGLWFSQIVNAAVLQKIKKNQVSKGESTTDKKGIYARAIISSIPSIILDSCLFNLIAFLGVMPVGTVIIMIFTQILVKAIVEFIIQAPISSMLVPRLVTYADIDVIDDKISNLNPFKA